MSKFLAAAILVFTMTAAASAGGWKLNPQPKPSYHRHRACDIYVIREYRPRKQRFTYPTNRYPYQYKPPQSRQSSGGGGYYLAPKYVEPLIIINPYVKD